MSLTKDVGDVHTSPPPFPQTILTGKAAELSGLKASNTGRCMHPALWYCLALLLSEKNKREGSCSTFYCAHAE